MAWRVGGWIHRLWWKLPDRVMTRLDRAGSYVWFWLWGPVDATRTTWRLVRDLRREAGLAVVAFVLFFFFRARGDNNEAWDQAVDTFVWTLAALGALLGVVFLWNLVLSYPRRHWNLAIDLDKAEGRAKSAEYERDFYADSTRRELRAAALLLKTELEDIQEKVDLIEATVAGHTYWDGFAFPAAEWQKFRQLVADDPTLYGVVSRAYVKANLANECIWQRRTRAKPGSLIGRADEEDLPGVRELAGEAIEALDAIIERESSN